jgi:hypothetical protein
MMAQRQEALVAREEGMVYCMGYVSGLFYFHRKIF